MNDTFSHSLSTGGSIFKKIKKNMLERWCIISLSGEYYKELRESVAWRASSYIFFQFFDWQMHVLVTSDLSIIKLKDWETIQQKRLESNRALWNLKKYEILILKLILIFIVFYIKCYLRYKTIFCYKVALNV